MIEVIDPKPIFVGIEPKFSITIILYLSNGGSSSKVVANVTFKINSPIHFLIPIYL